VRCVWSCDGGGRGSDGGGRGSDGGSLQAVRGFLTFDPSRRSMTDRDAPVLCATLHLFSTSLSVARANLVLKAIVRAGLDGPAIVTEITGRYYRILGPEQPSAQWGPMLHSLAEDRDAMPVT
jgi:hypothetical protein